MQSLICRGMVGLINIHPHAANISVGMAPSSKSHQPPHFAGLGDGPLCLAAVGIALGWRRGEKAEGRGINLTREWRIGEACGAARVEGGPAAEELAGQWAMGRRRCRW